MPPRYRPILLSAGLFVVLAVIALGAGLGLAASARQSHLAAFMATREALLNQQMITQLNDLENEIAAGSASPTRVGNFARLYDSFDAIHRAFTNYEQGGGEVLGPAGELVFLPAITSPAGRDLASQISDLVTSIDSQVHTIAKADKNTLSPADRDKASAIIREKSREILPKIDDLTLIFGREAADKLQLQHLVNTIVLVIAAANLLYLAFVLIARLRQKDAALDGQLADLDARLARAEAQVALFEKIHATTEEGLFHLDRALTVQPPVTAAFNTLLGWKGVAVTGKKFLDLFRKTLSESSQTQLRDHLDKLLDPKAKPHSLRRSAENIRRIEAHIDDGRGGFTTTFYDFRFQRLTEPSGAVAGIIGNLREAESPPPPDLSDARIAEEKTARRIGLARGSAHVEKADFQNFHERTRQRLNAISVILKSGRGAATPESSDTLRAKTTDILSHIGFIRAETDILGIRAMDTPLREMADKLTELQNKETLGGNDFLPIVMKLAECLNLLDEIRVLREGQ